MFTPGVPQKLAPFTAEDAAERVARGAAWFDHALPDWFEVDIDRLDMNNAQTCMLGQNADALVPHHYIDMLEDSLPPGESLAPLDFHDVLDSNQLSEKWAYEHGFQAVSSALVVSLAEAGEFMEANAREIRARYEMLRLAWIAEIRKRQNATDDAFLDQIAGPVAAAV